MTSSASNPTAPAVAMPRAASTSSRIGTCGDSSSGTTSMSADGRPSRCAGSLASSAAAAGAALRLQNAVRLVGRDQLDPPGRPPVQVEAGDHPGRPGIGDHPGQDVQRSADRVDRPPVGRGHRGGHGEEGPEVDPGEVEQLQHGPGRYPERRPGTTAAGPGCCRHSDGQAAPDGLWMAADHSVRRLGSRMALDPVPGGVTVPPSPTGWPGWPSRPARPAPTSS